MLAHFEVASLEGFGCADLPLAIRAAGAVLAYVQEAQKGLLHQLTSLETYSTHAFMTLDTHTRRNLELFETGRSGSVKGSLLWVLDKTRSPMGGRLIRRWISQPLLDIGTLQQRQQVIGELLGNTLLQARLAEDLKRAGDIERLINRVRQRIATPRDLVALASGLRVAARVRSCLFDDAQPDSGGPQAIATGMDNENMSSLVRITQRLADNEDIIQLIERAIVEEPPISTSEGGVIRPGFNLELDSIKQASQDGQKWIADLEQRERRRTGINNLKVGYNKGPGYYIEVSNANASRVPKDYIRKQTLTNCERYITPDLKEYETLILNAQERMGKLESELFAQLRADIAIHAAEQILDTAHAVAEIDVYLSLTQVAAQHNYCRPQLNEGDTVHIVAGRHPVVEQTQADFPFVPNDTNLSNSDAQIVIITGPNMAGKSTYLRQVALITLMAQIGSYVPAEAATIGLVDRIFTRIGAQDDLATGQSTFMVEMVETANILHHATPRSLVILDEIGRGTSTYDGLAIARAVVEHLHNETQARVLFATHYHELSSMANELFQLSIHTMAISDDGQGDIVFLHRVTPGCTGRSYGVHVAKLAGMPLNVVKRAEEVLKQLETDKDIRRLLIAETNGRYDLPVGARFITPNEPNNTSTHYEWQSEEARIAAQTLEQANGAEPDLNVIDVCAITPLDALNLLFLMQKRRNTIRR